MQIRESTEVAHADRFNRVFERLVRRMRSIAAASGDAISPATASALGRLSREGPHGVTALADAEGVSQPAMTQLVDRVVKAGLAQRSRPNGDRRSVVVDVTPAGTDAIAERSRHRTEHLAELLTELTADERETIVAALPALEKLLDIADARAT